MLPYAAALAAPGIIPALKGHPCEGLKPASGCMLPHLDALCLLQEASTHGHQGIFWPLVEPVDGCAVDHGRELPGSHTQDGAHGGETQNHLDVGQSKRLWGVVAAEVRHVILADGPSGSTVLSRSQGPRVGGSLLQSPVSVAGYLSEPAFSFTALCGAVKFKAAPHLAE